MPRVLVRLDGLLDEQWAAWLDGFTLAHCENGETLLAGEVQDQAALYGLLAKLRDLGVKLIAVNFETLAGEQEAECGQEVSKDTPS